MNTKNLKTKVFESLGEASMQWNPRPSGVFDSSGCAAIGDKLWETINSKLTVLMELLQRARPELSHYPVLQTDIDEAIKSLKEKRT